ncbi:nucleotide sugar dehydrogenase [Pelomyxa schiedti]|nr:nucleotide sugar dehydrogenase [Pelomyxa schiedti]
MSSSCAVSGGAAAVAVAVAVAVKTRMCCIGAGYVGGPSSAVFADRCPDVDVVVADLNADRVDAWVRGSRIAADAVSSSGTKEDVGRGLAEAEGVLPMYEPGLAEVVGRATVRGNLRFTTEVGPAVAGARIVLLCVNTPNKEYGTSGVGGYDLTSYESAARCVAQNAVHDMIVVEKSTVPVRTADVIETVLAANVRDKSIKFDVLSSPEFLAEGTAIHNLETPDRVLIGCHDTPSGHLAEEELAAVYRKWIPQEKIVVTKIWSSELSKLAANALLAQRISSINAFSALCEASGADVQEVARVVGMDTRIGPYFLNSSVGFGGSCFGKDLQGLIYLCESYHLHEVAEYWRQVLKINNYQKKRFSAKIISTMFGTVRNKTICILGMAFKKNTGDTRDSAALDVIQHLLADHANIVAYDPKVPISEIKTMFPAVKCTTDPYEAACGSDAVAVLTEWDVFKTLDYTRIYNSMRRPAFVFDGRNILNHTALRDIGMHTQFVKNSATKTHR